MTRLIDLTQEIYHGMPVFPGHLKTAIWRHDEHSDTAAKFDGGWSYASMGLLLSDHGPTHVDAMSHLDPSPAAPSIDLMDLDRFQGPGICLDLSATPLEAYISGQDLEEAAVRSALSIKPDMVVLLRTGAYERLQGDPRYLRDYPGLAESACDWLLDHEVRLFGVDAPSPDHPSSRTYPVHMMCRERRMTHYENLASLDLVIDLPFHFMGLPLKIRGGTGSPVRAVAIVDD